MDDPPVSARTVSVAPERISTWIDGFADRHGAVQTSADESRVLLLGADGDRAWLELPFPPWEIPVSRVLTSLSVEVNRDRRVGVLLVRRGGYAAGVFHGAELLSSKVGSGYVQGTTKAGGWSQQRYARRRDNQARAAFGQAADVAARILVPEQDRIEALVLGGDQVAVTATLSDPRLAALAALAERRPRPLLAVADPRLKILQATASQFRAVRIRLDP
ncbi:hypothetical protein M6D93_16100 [Jatrophihabitans telluris]|uniref:Actinobacteria/chloroflexi VLRF1 release factor domain-containing protein n=1 Tax=Jatrophihabitans telluris TaxID=2038343 RepID=A0ABY4QY18_9ACTN|nr:acVLRF1 family peptidyl-tRNA hydrolase [Jatrophihabitans telluris]UQX87810.1 hypothetical protein M6D93_16100 [Jatrophihabitans telluris]